MKQDPQCIYKSGGAENQFLLFNPLTTNVPHHIEISQLTCITNQLTGFYMMENIGR